MAHALGSLDPSICAHLEECKALLSEKGDPEKLSQVLIEMRLLDETKWSNKVHIFTYKLASFNIYYGMVLIYWHSLVKTNLIYCYKIILMHFNDS